MSGQFPLDRRLLEAEADATPSGRASSPSYLKPDITKLSCDVLVIEDEVLMQALLSRYISSFISQRPQLSHLKTEMLSSGWDLIHADLSTVKVAVVDILLPQVTGVDLIRVFRSRFPDMGIVPISGMATEPMKRALKELLAPGTELLQKPLRKEEFLEAFEKAYLYKQPQAPSVPLAMEEGEQLWRTVNPKEQRTEIPIVRRKLLRKRAS